MGDNFGLSESELPAYRAALKRPHDIRTEYRIMDLNSGAYLGSLSAAPGSGELNVDADGDSTHSMNVTLVDRDGLLDGPGMNRKVQVRYLVRVAELGRYVVGSVFTGPVIKPPTRFRSEVTLDCADPSAIGLRGVPADTITVGNAVEAIKTILRDKCGFTEFRFPASSVRLDEPVNVGRDDELLPWIQCQSIARAALDKQLLIDGDGTPVLRDFPVDPDPGMTLDGLIISEGTREPPQEFFNEFRVIGKNPRDQVVLALPETHEFSRESLAVNGVPQRFTYEETDSKLNTKAKVARRAERVRAQRTAALAERRTYEVSPVPNFWPLDVVPAGNERVTLRRWTMPLGSGGSMSIGFDQPVGR